MIEDRVYCCCAATELNKSVRPEIIKQEHLSKLV